MGNAGRPMHPQPRVGKIETTRVSHHGRTGFTRHSRTRMVLTVSFGLSSVTGLSCHRHLQRPCKLDISVGMSGPHDFSVRGKPHSSLRPQRPSHPASYVRDDRETPLEWKQDGGVYGFDLGQTRSEIFLEPKLDGSANQCMEIFRFWQHELRGAGLGSKPHSPLVLHAARSADRHSSLASPPAPQGRLTSGKYFNIR